MHRTLLGLAWAAMSMTAIAADSPLSPPSAAPVRNVVDTYYGVRVDDPYRYLETSDDAAVSQWLKAQASYARTLLDSLPGRAALLRRIEEIDTAAAAEIRRPVWLTNDRILYLKRGPQEARAKLYMREGASGEERLLVDPEVVSDRDKNPSLHFYSPSDTGRYVAYGIAQGGAEVVRLSVLDTRTSRVVGPPRASGNVSANVIAPRFAWSADETTYYYNQKQELRPGMPLTEKYLNSTAFAYRTSEPNQLPRPVLGNGTKSEPRLDPDAYPYVEILRDSGYALGIALLEIRSLISLYLAPQSELQREPVPWRRIVGFEDRVRSYAVHGDDLYLVSEKDAPRFQVLRTSLSKPDLSHASTVLPESQGVVAEIAAAADALYVRLVDGGPSRLVRVAYGTNAVEEIALPFTGAARIAYADPRRPGILLELAGWTQAPAVYSYEPATARLARLELRPRTSLDELRGMVVRTARVRSHDGALVPLTIIHKEGLELNGGSPAILTGYGAYGASFEPEFDARWLAWLERGGIYAIANVRGGGEYGEAWHLGGFQATKPNTWKDVIACASYLIDQRYTSAKRLGLIGASAGGILAGRALTERPDLFAAVVPMVGMLDAIRAETSPGGPGNTREFGSVKSEAGFNALFAMSTYHHVTAGERYPGVMLTHGVNDPRVPVWQSAKTAARLQAASASKRPVLLRLDYQAGHGIGSSAVQLREEFADILAFMLWQFDDPAFQPARNASLSNGK